MKKGQIKINLDDVFEMKSRSMDLIKMVDNYHLQSIDDHRKMKDMQTCIDTSDREAKALRSVLDEVKKSPYAYASRFFITNNDLVLINEDDFNKKFTAFLQSFLSKKKK